MLTNRRAERSFTHNMEEVKEELRFSTFLWIWGPFPQTWKLLFSTYLQHWSCVDHVKALYVFEWWYSSLTRWLTRAHKFVCNLQVTNICETWRCQHSRFACVRRSWKTSSCDWLESKRVVCSFSRPNHSKKFTALWSPNLGNCTVWACHEISLCAVKMKNCPNKSVADIIFLLLLKCFSRPALEKKFSCAHFSLFVFHFCCGIASNVGGPWWVISKFISNESRMCTNWEALDVRGFFSVSQFSIFWL